MSGSSSSSPPSGTKADPTLVLDHFGTAAGAQFESSPITERLCPGEMLLVLGGVGAGKSLLAQALSGVRRPGLRTFGGAHLGDRPVGVLRHDVALAPQDARLAVLATDQVGRSMLEAVRARLGSGSRVSWPEAADQLRALGLADPDRIRPLRFRDLSFGERRRVLLALALARNPTLLVADAPLEGLDENGRERVVQALRAHLAAGALVVASSRGDAELEHLATRRVALTPKRFSVQAAPRSERPPSVRPPAERSVGGDSPEPLLELDRLGVHRGGRGLLTFRRDAHAVDGASLRLAQGEILALVGESGSGKSSLLEAVAGLLPVAFGRIRFQGKEIAGASERRIEQARRRIQLVFQDAAATLTADKTVAAHIEEALGLTSARKRESARVWLERTGLAPELLNLPADCLSTGEAQRVDLARSLAVRPDLVLFDGPERAGLERDETLRGLLEDERKTGVSFVVSARFPGLCRGLAGRIAFMLAGRIVEIGPSDSVLSAPLHPYTRALIDTDPTAPRRGLRLVLEGPPPDPLRPSRGCPHQARCPKVDEEVCGASEPPLRELAPGSGHRVACFFAEGSG